MSGYEEKCLEVQQRNRNILLSEMKGHKMRKYQLIILQKNKQGNFYTYNGRLWDVP